MNRENPTLIVIVSDDYKNVVGFDCEVPLPLAFAVIVGAFRTGDVPLNMIVKTASEMGIEKCDHPDCIGGAHQDGPKGETGRKGKMDPTLRARQECPQVIAPNAGELGAMLSILSEKVAAGKGGK